MTVFTLEIPGRPTGKARPRIVRGHAFTPRATELAENEFRRAWQDAGEPRLEGAIELLVTLSVSRPRGHFNSKGEINTEGSRHPWPWRQKPDVDNAIKLVMDALNGCAWRDDVQVVEATVRRKWAPIESTRVLASELTI